MRCCCGLMATSDKIRRLAGPFRSRIRQWPVRNSCADSISDAAAYDITIRVDSGADLMRRESMYNDSLFNAFARSFEARSQSDMSMTEYLESCRSDPMRYANGAERLLAAIGEPQMIDTAKDS